MFDVALDARRIFISEPTLNGFGRHLSRLNIVQNSLGCEMLMLVEQDSVLYASKIFQYNTRYRTPSYSKRTYTTVVQVPSIPEPCDTNQDYW